MNPDRPYSCRGCLAAFKLKWHLTKHLNTCTGNVPSFCCQKCGGKFSSKKTLKVHQQSCKPKISYKCKECDQTFATMKLKDAHRRKYHTNSNCEFCDYEVKHAQNLKRHMRTKHKNLTPSRAKQLENLISESNDKKEKKIKCGACHKCFFDKSTLNRH